MSQLLIRTIEITSGEIYILECIARRVWFFFLFENNLLIIFLKEIISDYFMGSKRKSKER